MGETVSVLIVDDHPVVREGLRAMLRAPDVSVVGEARSGSEAVRRVCELRPKVVLMDVKMPDMDGLAATAAIKREMPSTSVIIITGFESKDYLRRAIEAGAAGYLVKGMSREVLLESVRLAREGGSLVDARLLSEIFAQMQAPELPYSSAALSSLTPRELQALRLLSRGMTNKEIAREMHYSLGSVKNLVQNVIEKLGVSDRTQAAVFAVRAGLDVD